MSIMQPPEAVRGMTSLDKDAFRKNVDFPVIEIDSKDVALMRRMRLDSFVIGVKWKPIKTLMDSEKEGKKYIVFNPDEVDKDEVKTKIMDNIKNEVGPEKELEWGTLPQEVTFDHWDMKSIFKAVLPIGIEYSSFTQTGHIIHCNFADETLPYRFIIAQILLNKMQFCKSVVQKGDIITNVYRNLDLVLLAGEEDYVTEVKESGIRFKMDFSKVYWNSRLSHEHERIAKMFNAQSLVYDACSGIGPFVIPAIKKQKPRRVMANDLNPESFKWLKVNLELNKVKKDVVDVFNMDANDFIKDKISEDVIRLMREDSKIEEDEYSTKKPTEIHVIMNLPAHAIHFLPSFRGVLRKFKDELEVLPEKKRWKWNVYCYLFAKSRVDVPKEWFEEEARRMCDSKTEWTRSLVDKCHHVRTVSSRKEMFCAQLSLPYEFLLAEPLPTTTPPRIEPEETEEPHCKRAKTEKD